jgi:hypothetical protein
MPTDNSATTTATSSNPTSNTERNGEKPSENSGSYDTNDSSGTASSKSSPDSEEVVENKIDVERYLEEASLKCKDPILTNFATYCIVIPMTELPNRKLMCRLQIHSPSQNDLYNASFREYVRDADGNMGFLERNNRMRHVGDVIVGVNGIHLKGWDGQEVFELIGILLKDENTTELRLMLEDQVIAAKYRTPADDVANDDANDSANDDADVEIFLLLTPLRTMKSKPGSN